MADSNCHSRIQCSTLSDLGAPKDEAAASAEGALKSSKGVAQEEVLIFATPGEVVESYAHVVKQSGLVPVSVDLAPLALHRMLVRHTR